MRMRIDLRTWAREYEKDYEADVERVGARYPIFIEDSGKVIIDKSPYFETVSKRYQKRGYLKWEEFFNIGLWKTRRQRKRYKDKFNRDNIERITGNAIKATKETQKVKLLLELKGVGIPVSSAILTAIYPTQYCVIDFRAWRALEWYQRKVNLNSYRDYCDFLDSYDSRASVNSYIAYLKAVRRIAEEHNMTPRKVEMALWKFDQMKGQKSEE